MSRLGGYDVVGSLGVRLVFEERLLAAFSHVEASGFFIENEDGVTLLLARKAPFFLLC